MKEKIHYYKIGKRLAHHYPELAIQLNSDLENGRISDELVRTLWQRFIALNPIPSSKKDKSKHRMDFIIISVKRFDPDAIKINTPLRNGLRPILAEILKCDPSQVSTIFRIGRNFLIIYKSYDLEIDRIFSELFKFE